MARRQGHPGPQIGAAERGFEDELTSMRDGDHAAGLLEEPHLELDPARNVLERAGKPAGLRVAQGRCPIFPLW
jgi:hypothetical protein